MFLGFFFFRANRVYVCKLNRPVIFLLVCLVLVLEPSHSSFIKWGGKLFLFVHCFGTSYIHARWPVHLKFNGAHLESCFGLWLFLSVSLGHCIFKLLFYSSILFIVLIFYFSQKYLFHLDFQFCQKFIIFYLCFSIPVSLFSFYSF